MYVYMYTLSLLCANGGNPPTQVVHCWSLYLKNVHVHHFLHTCILSIISALCMSLCVHQYWRVATINTQSRNLIHVHCRCLYLQTLHAHHLLHTCIF